MITDDLNNENWGPPPTKIIKVDRAAAMLKYSVWIADPGFTCKVFDPPKPCFVWLRTRGHFCTLHDLGAVASVKSDQQQYEAMSAFPTQKTAMTKHLESGRHKASVSVEKHDEPPFLRSRQCTDEASYTTDGCQRHP